MRRQPFFCDRCGGLVRYPDDRVVVSVDFMRANGTKRFRRVARTPHARLCVDCMEVELEEMGA